MRRVSYIALLFLLTGTAALAQSGGGYKILVATVSSGAGGNVGNGGGSVNYGVIGQPAIGPLTGGTFDIAAGNIPATHNPLPIWTTYMAWQHAYFTPAEIANPTISDPTADPDGDGMDNLEEYAFHTNPLMATGSTQYPLLFPDYLSLVYTRSLAATDVSYNIEESTNTFGWSAVSPVNVVLSDDGFVQTVMAQVPRSDAGPGGELFLRLRVTR